MYGVVGVDVRYVRDDWVNPIAVVALSGGGGVVGLVQVRWMRGGGALFKNRLLDVLCSMSVVKVCHRGKACMRALYAYCGGMVSAHRLQTVFDVQDGFEAVTGGRGQSLERVVLHVAGRPLGCTVGVHGDADWTLRELPSGAEAAVGASVAYLPEVFARLAHAMSRTVVQVAFVGPVVLHRNLLDDFCLASQVFSSRAYLADGRVGR